MHLCRHVGQAFRPARLPSGSLRVTGPSDLVLGPLTDRIRWSGSIDARSILSASRSAGRLDLCSASDRMRQAFSRSVEVLLGGCDERLLFFRYPLDGLELCPGRLQLGHDRAIDQACE